jgi:catechol 2,3-dioxygenase-like lactoylglutathione lyase family enzyme
MPTPKKLTPILYVDQIEPSIAFWVERLGFERGAEVPHGDALGFLILQKGPVEVMYQTRASVQADAPAVAERHPTGGSFLFMEVEDLDAVERAMEGIEVVVPRRRTFYGAEEIFVREPAGNLVGFAQFAAE